MADEAAANVVQSHAKVMDDIASSMKGEISDISAMKMPDAPNLPPPPQPKFSTPMEEFGSIASTLGIFASLLTRRPLTSALNASAAAMQSIRQGDYTNYQTAMDQWKAQSDYAEKTADWQWKRYQAILDNKTMTMDAKSNMIRAMQAGDSDIVGAQQLRDHGLDGVMKLQEYRLRMALAAQRAANRVNSIPNEVFWGYTQQALDAWKAKNPGKEPSQSDMARIYTDAYSSMVQAKSPGESKIAGTADSATSLASEASNIIKQAPWAVGLPGDVAMLPATVYSWWTGKSDSVHQLRDVVARLKQNMQALANSRQLSATQMQLVDQMSYGTGFFDTPANTRKSLERLLGPNGNDGLISQMSNMPVKPGAEAAPSGGVSRQWAAGPNGINIYTDDSGVSWFNEDGTPYDDGGD